MDHHHLDPYGNFTDAEFMLMSTVFKRLIARTCYPIMMLVINGDGLPFGLYHPGFNPPECDQLAEATLAALALISSSGAP